MYKLIVIFSPKSGMSQEDFANHWLTTHAELGAKIPGVLKYTINITQTALSEEEDDIPGGVAELCFEDEAAFEHAMGSPENEVAGADLENFVGKMVAFTAEGSKIIG